MTDTGWYRLGALSGIAAVLLYVAATVVLGTPPAPDSTSPQIAQWFHSHRSGLIAGTMLFTLASVFLTWFAGEVRATLSEAEGGRGTMSALFFGAELAAIVVGALSLVPLAAGAFKLGNAAGAQLASRADLLRVLFDVSNVMSVSANAFLSLSLFAASVVIVRTCVVAGWLGGVSAVGAALGVLSLGGMAAETGPFAVGGPIFILTFVFFFIWAIGVAVSLFRRPLMGATPPAAVSAATRES